MRFTILTLFPEYFQTPLGCSLLGRAQASGLVSIDFINLREFGEGKYRAVDASPYGGGVGMVLMPNVVEKALTSLLGGEQGLGDLEGSVRKSRLGQELSETSGVPYVLGLSPQGKGFTAKKARDFAMHPCGTHLVLLCGHYEGIDERILEAFVHEEISIGDYVLTGGEPAALVVLDAVSRFIPGVVGDQASVHTDTFESSAEMLAGGLKYPVYTRPQVWHGREVPEVLLSGHHEEITKWRLKQSKERTLARRPDLISKKSEK